MSEELKACPFCGGKAVICKPLEAITGWVIRCEEHCCCEKSSMPSLNKKEDLTVLITAWNTRPTTLESSVVAEAEAFIELAKGYRESRSIDLLVDDRTIGIITALIAEIKRQAAELDMLKSEIAELEGKVEELTLKPVTKQDIEIENLYD